MKQGSPEKGGVAELTESITGTPLDTPEL